MSTSDPSFSRFKESNYLPSDVETRKIRDLISLDEQEGLRIDGEIAAAQAIIHQLRHQREEVDTTLAIRRASISPLRRLPPEILGYIFLLTIPYGIRYLRPDSRTSPLLLRETCKAWKAIAESTSNLWSSISFNFNMCNGVEAQLSDGIQGWLLRSSRHPIDIQIVYLLKKHTTDEVPDLDQLFEMLMPFVTRWRYVSLHMPLHMMQRLLGCYESPLLMLHCLELHAFGPADDVPTVFLTDSATAFRHLILHGHFVGSQLLVLPWHQVTYILMKGTPSPNMSIDKCMAIIRQCSCLEYASLKLYSGAQASVSASRPTTHLRLNEFVIIGGSKLVLALLDNLTLPALRNLTIDYGGPLGSGWIRNLLPCLTSFISRSSCPIHSIHLPNHIPCRDAEEADLFVSFVEQFPSLRRVKIQYKKQNCLSSRARELLSSRRSQDKKDAC
jgi:hypothetical protein